MATVVFVFFYVIVIQWCALRIVSVIEGAGVLDGEFGVVELRDDRVVVEASSLL